MKLVRYLKKAAWAFGSFVMIIVVYGFLLAFPEPLFACKVEYKNFRVYSREPLDSRIKPALDTVEARLAVSELNDPRLTHRVFVCGTPAWNAFFNGPSRQAMGHNFELHNSIFVPMMDLDRSMITHFDGRVSELPWILAHEMTHTLVQKRIGLRKLWSLPFWKKEGYAEYIGSGHPVALKDGVRLLETTQGGAIQVSARQWVPRHYFEAEMLWTYLLDVRRLRFDQVMDEIHDKAQIEAEMKQWAKTQNQ